MKKLMILMIAVGLVASAALAASAAEWSFYGSARIKTFSQDVETPGQKDDTDTDWDKQGNGTIGATVKVNDSLEGLFEYGSNNTVNLRRLFAEWNFGAGKLLAGQEYTPISDICYSNQVWWDDDDLNSCGIPYAGRMPMLQLTFGSLQVALVKPNDDWLNGAGFAINDADVTFPKLEVSYNFRMNNFFVDLYGGYQTFEADNRDVDAYVLGIGGGVDLDGLFARANVYMAQNGRAYGLADIGDNETVYNPVTGKMVDNDTFGWALVGGYKLSDALTIEAGYGATQHELDAAGSQEDETAYYYLQTVITLAPGVTVTPEVGVLDFQDDASGNDEGKITYVGAKWQLNF